MRDKMQTWINEAPSAMRDAAAGMADAVWDVAYRRIYAQCRAHGLPHAVADDAATRAAASMRGRVRS